MGSREFIGNDSLTTPGAGLGLVEESTYPGGCHPGQTKIGERRRKNLERSVESTHGGARPLGRTKLNKDE